MRREMTYRHTFILILLLSTLACSSLTRWRENNRQDQALATGAAIIDEGNALAADAYRALQRLPGYRLESKSLLRDGTNTLTTYTSINEYDARNNMHAITQTPTGEQTELYFVNGHIYVYDAQYNGWVDTGAASRTEAQQRAEAPFSGLGLGLRPIQLLTQFGAIPTRSGSDILNNRPVTRYQLQYITEALGKRPVNSALDMEGTLWIDDESGALIRSEILLYEGDNPQPGQEYLLEVSQIGQIEPITIPTPVVDPPAIVAATATAQSWVSLEATVIYQGQPVEFELLPIRVTPISRSDAELELILRQLPVEESDWEPLLTQLGDQLTLSIPQRNQTVESSGFLIKGREAGDLHALYFFNADVGDFSHVELILAGPGNPALAPVPVE